MQANYPVVLKNTLKFEGGFVNNPSDPGGATNMGITHATLSAWRHQAVSVDDVKALTLEEASDIYKALYWDHIQGDVLPNGVDMAMFDYAVNSGNGAAARALQAVLGVDQDGQIGPQTLAALAQHDPKKIAIAICQHRQSVLERLSTFRIFGHGWTSRITAVENIVNGM